MTPDALKKLGGARPGAGRKPDPNKMVNIQAKVPPEIKQWLEKHAENKGMTLSKLILEILRAHIAN